MRRREFAQLKIRLTRPLLEATTREEAGDALTYGRKVAGDLPSRRQRHDLFLTLTRAWLANRHPGWEPYRWRGHERVDLRTHC